jgi:hypothetical protein
MNKKIPLFECVRKARCRTSEMTSIPRFQAPKTHLHTEFIPTWPQGYPDPQLSIRFRLLIRQSTGTVSSRTRSGSLCAPIISPCGRAYFSLCLESHEFFSREDSDLEEGNRSKKKKKKKEKEEK